MIEFKEKNIFIGKKVEMRGNVIIERNTTVYDDCELGDNVKIGHHCIIYPGTKIGKNTEIQDNVVIGKQPRSLSISTFKIQLQSPTVIGENNLICTGTIIYAGTKTGINNLVADNVIIREGVILGENVKVGKAVIIEFDAQIGNNVSIQTRALIAEKSIIENYAFIGPSVNMALDKYMARKGNPLNPIKVKEGAAIGASCVLMPGVEVGKNALVAAGSIINRSLEQNYIYIGNPLRKLRKVRDDEIKIN